MHKLFTLLGLVAYTFGQASLEARPRPELPPFPESPSFMARFDRGESATPTFAAVNVSLVEGWSWTALNVGPGGYIGWAGNNPQGSPIINPGTGSIRFWYAPTWNSGERKETEPGVLLDVFGADRKMVEWFSLVVLPDGSAIGVTDASGKPIMGAEIKWEAGQWHQIAVTYSPKETLIYIDSVLAAVGPALLNIKAKTYGVTLGSSVYADNQALGHYDEFTTFNYDLTADDVGQNFRCYAPWAAKGAITPEEDAEEERLAEIQRVEREAQAALMAEQTLLFGPLDAGMDCTTGPLRLTNMVFVRTNLAPGITNYAQVTIAGGEPDTLYDVFRTREIIGGLTACWWTYVGSGYQCETLTFTNEPGEKAFYIAADRTDSDGDTLTDAYEALVVKTLPGEAPDITITSPTNGTVAAAPTNMILHAWATNFITQGYFQSKVDFYANGALMGTGYPTASTAATVTWAPIAGNYALQAVLTDGVGAVATSAVVNVSISLPALANLKCWLKADALVLTNGAPVTNWVDSSGFGNNATNGTATASPSFLTNQVNGLPAIKFDGVNDVLRLQGFLNGSTKGEAFVVIKPNSTGQPIWHFSSDLTLTKYASNSIIENFGRGDDITVATNGDFRQFNVYSVSSQSNSWAARVNGVLLKQDNNTTINFGSAPALGGCQRSGIFDHGDPTMAEVLVYDTVLTDEQRIAVGQYLNNKYAVVSNTPVAPTLYCSAPDPQTIAVNWAPVTNCARLVLKREHNGTTTEFSLGSTSTSYTDSIVSFDPVTYTLMAQNFNGQTTSTLVTPLMVFDSPANGSWYLTGQSLPVTISPYQSGMPGPGSSVFTPTQVDIFQNSILRYVKTSAPWSFTITNTSPDRYQIMTRAFDSAGNTRYTAPLGINFVESTDTDGDGVPDMVDYWPHDPTRHSAGTGNTNDFTPPVIVITQP